MHCHRGFSGSCHSLHNNIVVGGFPDNIVLFLLDGGHDLPQHGLFVFRQVFCQQFVIGHNFTVKIVQKLSLFNLISPLQLQVNVHLFVAGSQVAAFSQPVFIVGIGHGRPPVDYGLMCGVFGNAPLADVE